MMACEAIELERPARGAARPIRSGRVARLVTAVLRLLQAWRERAWLRRELPMIDARMLRDIGLTRAELEGEAEKPIWRF